jgi:hypothetical protein
VRAAFRAGYEQEYHKYVLPKLARDLDSGIVAVLHLRRGDILESRVIDKTHRLTSFSVLASTIKDIMAAKQSYDLASSLTNASYIPLPISFFILAEGSKDSGTVMEYDEANPHILHPLNITLVLGDVCTAKSMCKVEVLWQASFYESFTVMCEADVLVTSTSGFAWVAGALCVNPMTVGIEGWNDFEAFANVVPIKPQGPLWAHSTTVLLEGIDEGWRQMLSSRIRRRSGSRVVLSPIDKSNDNDIESVNGSLYPPWKSVWSNSNKLFLDETSSLVDLSHSAVNVFYRACLTNTDAPVHSVNGEYC